MVELFLHSRIAQSMRSFNEPKTGKARDDHVDAGVVKCLDKKRNSHAFMSASMSSHEDRLLWGFGYGEKLERWVGVEVQGTYAGLSKLHGSYPQLAPVYPDLKEYASAMQM